MTTPMKKTKKQMTKPNPKAKRVKAWAIIGSRGKFYAAYPSKEEAQQDLFSGEKIRLIEFTFYV